jgi:hypothetical protein
LVDEVNKVMSNELQNDIADGEIWHFLIVYIIILCVLMREKRS